MVVTTKCAHCGAQITFDEKEEVAICKYCESVNSIHKKTISDNDGTSNISQFGNDNFVVITLPYVLSENEDIDSIAVWFINDNGELESISATYNNGYVTFKTNHFSYYTVTRLTPREKCELYGHTYNQELYEGDCTKDRYIVYYSW